LVKRSKIILLMAIVLIIFAGCGYSYEETEEPENPTEAPPPEVEVQIPSELPFAIFPPPRESGIVEVYAFGLSSADAILITTENYVVMIDTGENQHGRYIADRLFDKKIFHIDYMIITHFDRDHVGGARDIIRFSEVRNIIVPNYHKESRAMERFRTTKQNAGIEAYVLTETKTLVLDDTEFIIYPPQQEFISFGYIDPPIEVCLANSNHPPKRGDCDTSGEERINWCRNSNEISDEDGEDQPRENDFSIVVSVAHGENNFLFTGDAMAVRLEEILEIDEIVNTDFDLLKLPHHGRRNRMTSDFLNTISPRYAISTCCRTRPTDERVIEILENIGTEIFFTKNGGVHARSDGNSLYLELIPRTPNGFYSP